MEWTYHITQSFTITRRHPLSEYLVCTAEASALEVAGASLTFSPGEIDEPLYTSLVTGYPQHVRRRPKNDLVAAVYDARGWT